MKHSAETNADFYEMPVPLNLLGTANQSANATDVQTLTGLIATSQSALTAEELARL